MMSNRHKLVFAIWLFYGFAVLNAFNVDFRLFEHLCDDTFSLTKVLNHITITVVVYEALERFRKAPGQPVTLTCYNESYTSNDLVTVM